MLDNNKLSHWFCAGVLGWALYFCFFGIPIFHIWLGASIQKVAICTVLCCALQMLFTPWIFAARPTPQFPTGKIGQRMAASMGWIISTAILLLCCVQYGKAIDQMHLNQRIIMIAGTLAVFSTASIAVILRVRKVSRLQ
jgi:hypothetical protein